MPAKILIIDDNILDPSRDDAAAVSGNALVGLTARVDKTGNEAIPIRGATWQEVMTEFDRKLAANGGEAFDGTILDIIFTNDVHGGMHFWQELVSQGREHLAGQLMILTEGRTVDDPVLMAFARLHAGGRIYSGKNHSVLSQRHICDFLSLIPNAVQCV